MQIEFLLIVKKFVIVKMEIDSLRNLSPDQEKFVKSITDYCEKEDQY